MKKFKSVLAVLLSICLIASAVSVSAFSANKSPDGVLDDISKDFTVEEKQNLASMVNDLIDYALNDILFTAISALFLRTNMVADYSDFDLAEFDNFYAGNDIFLTSPQWGSTWSLGYAESSIIPEDFGTFGKYCRGGYAPWWYTTKVYDGDDLKVRTVVMNDGSGRGSVVFAVLDCIGFSNADVRTVRASLADFAQENNIIGINISATHTHSSIDSQGVWDNPISTIINNFLSAVTGNAIKSRSGVDADYLNKIISSTKASVEEAYSKMTSGVLTYAKTDCSDYLKDRTYPTGCDTNAYRLFFTPANGSTPTLIASFGCHPEFVVDDWLPEDSDPGFSSKISGDFVTYMEKVVNAAGYNFLYIQGNVGTNNMIRDNINDGMTWTHHEQAQRFGYEMGYIVLSMSMTEAERIALNTATGDLLGIGTYSENEGYSVWYDGLATVESHVVAPILNFKCEQFFIEIESNVVEILTKSGLASNTLIYDKPSGKYYSVTEVGYLEIGAVSDVSSSLKVFMCPGELYGEMLVGCDELEGFEYDSLRSMYGENMIIFDLMNDAAGYISPDNYYTLNGYQYNKDEGAFEDDGWCMVVSLGKNTASTIIGKLVGLIENIKYENDFYPV